jgi:hypothetical protein
LCDARLSSLRRLKLEDQLQKDEERVIISKLDQVCLFVCISLLGHSLNGDHFESMVLGFLLTLGVDKSMGGVFRILLSYSTDSSKFINMARCSLLRVVLGLAEGIFKHPSRLFEGMMEHFVEQRCQITFV